MLYCKSDSSITDLKLFNRRRLFVDFLSKGISLAVMSFSWAISHSTTDLRNANRSLSLGVIDLIGKDCWEESLLIQTKLQTPSTDFLSYKLSSVSRECIIITLLALHICIGLKKRGEKPFPEVSLRLSVILSSGAELSHCEQRVQSLFTNQLSSAPALRVSPRHSFTHAVVPPLHFFVILSEAHREKPRRLLFLFSGAAWRRCLWLP